jgi:DNA polymerase III alpha subunit
LPNELIGFPRHLSQHVGGFVIARGLVERMVPVEKCGDGRAHRACNGTRTISMRWGC